MIGFGHPRTMPSVDQFTASRASQCDFCGISAPERRASEMRGRNWGLALAAGTLSALVVATAAAQTTDYTFTRIDVPGAAWTGANGINAAGQIVGYWGDSAGSHGFLYSGRSFTTFDVPGSSVTQAFGINDAAQIVGTFWNSTGPSHGYLYNGKSFTTIDVPGAGGTFASGINSAGLIVGTFGDSAGSHGFLY